MEKLNIKNSILIGFTLFSMFFGAGNLIFPPLLGAQSGSSFLLSILGFLLMAVIVPSVTVIVVAKHQGFKKSDRSDSSLFYTCVCDTSVFVDWTLCCDSQNRFDFI